MNTRWFMFYKVLDDSGKAVYTGFSSVKNLSMDSIEASERGWKSRGYGSSLFREKLVSKGMNWKFVWLSTIKDISIEQARDIKRGFIKTLGYPVLNVSKNPQASHETAMKFNTRSNYNNTPGLFV